jgi:hypothetical protein
MPQFFFSMADAPVAESHFPNVEQAKCEAARFVGQVIHDEARTFWARGDLFLTVSDEKGSVLFTMEVIGHDSARHN